MERSTANAGPAGGAPAAPDVALSAGVAVMERRADVVDRLRELDRALARAAAERLCGVNDLRLEAEAVHAGLASARPDAEGARARVRFREPSEMERRSVRFEVAAALRISERAAEAQLAFAEALCTELTATMGALTAGDITEYHARLIWEHSCGVPAEHRADFEVRALEAARKLSTARLRSKLHDIQQLLHPETATERHRAALDTRDVCLDPLADGMAILSIRDSAEKLVAVQNRLEDYARGIAADPNETRTVAQVRADVATDFLLTGQVGDWAITPTVHVVVPALSLAGVSEELAILDGYGPIDLATARTLLAGAEEFIRLITHPVTGTVLGVDSYRPSKKLRKWLEVRDETCRAPGCGRRAAYCEIDHTLERARDSGPTAFDNLANLCINHHKVKTVTEWSYRHLDSIGTLEWTSPLGAKYVTEPAARMRGAPHLADAARVAADTVDAVRLIPDVEYPEDSIPPDIYGAWQAAFDDELKEARNTGRRHPDGANGEAA